MAAHQALPSLGFSRQEHWSGLPFPSPMHESEKWKWSHSVVSDSSRPHGLQPMDCSPPGSSAHGIFQARVLEWGAIAFSTLPPKRLIILHLQGFLLSPPALLASVLPPASKPWMYLRTSKLSKCSTAFPTWPTHTASIKEKRGKQHCCLPILHSSFENFLPSATRISPKQQGLSVYIHDSAP